ncbi:MAG: pilin [Minisyncoccota bacterium]
MRPFILATFILFSLAPAALAQATVQPPPGSSCHSNSDCPTGSFCDPFLGTCSSSAGGQPTPTPTPTPTPVPTPTGGSGSGSSQSGGTVTSGGTQSGGTVTTNPSGNTSSGQNTILINPLGAGTSLPILLKDILQFVVQIGTVVIILMLVYVGFLFVTARGEPGKLTTARQALLWTVVGALILLGAQAISLGIQSTVQALSTGP